MPADRRALIIGSWLAKGRSKPSRQRIVSISDRWSAIFQEDRYGYRSVGNQAAMPVPMHNPTRAQVVDHFDRARRVSAESELLIYFVGHSANRGAHDLELILGIDEDGEDKTMALTALLQEARNARFQRIICILDTCHAGRTKESFAELRDQSFAMFATGDAYAFEANFSDALLRAFEMPIRKNDQRVDRREGGITYNKLFQEARRRLVTGSPKDSQEPICFGDLGNVVVEAAPRVVAEGYNVFASNRTIYGRIYIVLELLRDQGRSIDELMTVLRRHPAFVLKKAEEGNGTYLSSSRISEYVDFLRKAGWVVGRNDSLSVTAAGRSACSHAGFNRQLIEAIERNVLPADISLAQLDEFVQGLLDDMIPPTPVRIKDRAAMHGRALRLNGATRVALSVLPTTGRYLKGSADAIFPAEVGAPQQLARAAE